MKQSKKILSLLLSLIFVVSAFSIPSWAATFVKGDATDAKINIKYEVSKATEAPMADGSATYVGDDIYAVTVYAKCVNGIDILQACVHYDKTHFSPIMLYDGTDVYPGTDTYATDMGESAGYVYSLGDAWKNTGMYKANGTTATTAALAKVIGLGNAKANPISIDVTLISPDHANYPKYITDGLNTDTTGIIYAVLDEVAIAKNAYFNVTDGIVVNQDWVPMITMYFQRNAGVTDADVVGDTFGMTTMCPYGIDGTTDASGSPARNATATYTQGNPGCNVVSLATVTGAATPTYSVAKFKSQALFTGDKAVGANDLFQYRLTSVISNADFTAMNTNGNTIKKVGFIAANTGAADAADAKAAVEANSALPASWKEASTDYISCADTATADAYFGAIIKGISHTAQTTDIDCYAYVCYNDGTTDNYVWYTAAYTAAVSTGYDAAVNAWKAS